ncbi:MAG: TetR/AcrR family transcriptional regulator [Clostridia bacterium]|nr:TetR/AcrR family transcriptional regulator [Clostridia bacterium]
MSKSETKFNNTAKKMNDALVELLEEKEFIRISILEICKKAGVNRSTFYAHYSNTYDLLEEVHHNFTKEMYGYFESLSNIDYTKIQDLLIAPEYLMPYLEFIKKHKTFFKNYMNNLHNYKRDEFYSDIIERIIIPVCNQNGLNDQKTVDYLAKFYLQGINAIVTHWVSNDCQDNISFICDMIILCVKPYKSVIEYIN